MSGDGYARLSNDALVQKFIDAAKATGNVFAIDFKSLNNENVFDVLSAFQAKFTDVRVQEMQALGAELRRRRPVAETQKLFEHEDRDVRGWAQAQLDSVDPERANAALWSLRYDLTTQEVLAWRRRILQRPAPGSALRDRTVTQLVESFVDACERCYGATRFLTKEEGGWPTMKAYNKISLDFYGAAKELDRRGELGALLPLLNHPLITVRVWAARYCLPIATEQAITTLDQVSVTCDCVERSDALKTLDAWRSGQYRPFAY
jgi:hypothetical protein